MHGNKPGRGDSRKQKQRGRRIKPQEGDRSWPEKGRQWQRITSEIQKSGMITEGGEAANEPGRKLRLLIPNPCVQANKRCWVEKPILPSAHHSGTCWKEEKTGSVITALPLSNAGFSVPLQHVIFSLPHARTQCTMVNSLIQRIFVVYTDRVWRECITTVLTWDLFGSNMKYCIYNIHTQS